MLAAAASLELVLAAVAKAARLVLAASSAPPKAASLELVMAAVAKAARLVLAACRFCTVCLVVVLAAVV